MDEIRNRIVIPIKGLPAGESAFSFVIGNEFFQDFGNSQIKDADCSVKVHVTRRQTMLQINCIVGGYVVVECDRCLDDLTLKIDVDQDLTVGFDSVEVEDADNDEDVIVVDSSQQELSLDQFVYDYVCLSIPIVNVHPEGKCNPDVVKFIDNKEVESDSPFQNLKDMLKNKNN